MFSAVGAKLTSRVVAKNGSVGTSNFVVNVKFDPSSILAANMVAAATIIVRLPEAPTSFTCNLSYQVFASRALFRLSPVAKIRLTRLQLGT